MVFNKGYKKSNATYADLEKLSDQEVGEIFYGELVVSPRPGAPHARAETGIAGSIGMPFDQMTGEPDAPGGWWILVEPQLKFRTDCYPIPDVAGWRREHMPKAPRENIIELAPDWICEILSPSTAKYDRTVKRDIYHQMGVQHLWHVSPMERTLETFERDVEQWKLVDSHCDNANVRIRPFEAIEINIGRWWLPEDDSDEGP